MGKHWGGEEGTRRMCPSRCKRRAPPEPPLLEPLLGKSPWPSWQLRPPRRSTESGRSSLACTGP
eukprot:6759690-Pyramimonas_sp.AAC.1